MESRAEAYLVCYYGTAGGSGICGNDDTSVVDATDDGGSCAGSLWQGDTLGVESEVAVVVGEVEARHGCGECEGGGGGGGGRRWLS